MTGKERMLAAMRLEEADCVPVAPSMSNMIPAKLTGMPFWDLYLYKKVPRWRAYADAVKYFGFDGWLTYEGDVFENQTDTTLREVIVRKTPERIYTRWYCDQTRTWSDSATLYYIADPPTEANIEKFGLSAVPEMEEEVVVENNNYGTLDDYYAIYDYLGDDGIVGLETTLPGVGLGAEAVYRYYDSPSAVRRQCEQEAEHIVEFTGRALKEKMDFFFVGISGHMIWNPPAVFRELSLPCLQEVTRLCRDAGMPTMLHCCGPEAALVKIAAQQTDLSCINPLEIPAMGDCNLKQLKRDYGNKICLMGNLHTTDVMLRGTSETVAAASRQAIDDAGKGGGFILSTGDQCGRDTPEENIFAMIEVARTYGRY